MAYRSAGSMEAAVRSALNAKPPTPADKATAELALTLARAIDERGADYRTAGALLAALEALQMSPRARAVRGEAVKKDDKPAANPLDQLAERRRARGTASVDAAAP